MAVLGNVDIQTRLGKHAYVEECLMRYLCIYKSIEQRQRWKRGQRQPHCPRYHHCCLVYISHGPLNEHGPRVIAQWSHLLAFTT
jgi:hypothetical protein